MAMAFQNETQTDAFWSAAAASVSASVWRFTSGRHRSLASQKRLAPTRARSRSGTSLGFFGACVVCVCTEDILCPGLVIRHP